MDYNQNNQDPSALPPIEDVDQLPPEESPEAFQEQDEDDNSDHILKQYANEINLVDTILRSDYGLEKINKIASKVLTGINADETTQREWKSKVDDAQRLIKLVKEPKNYPLPQSANIKFPLITDACYQFAARTYPEVIQDNKVVKFETIGEDITGVLGQITKAASDHMNYQLVGPDSEWETSVDKLLVVLPAVGFVLKKTYFDPIKQQNVSELCNYKDIILRNSEDIQCLSDLRRITHILHCHPNDLLENCRAGIYCEDICAEVMNMYSATITDPMCTLYEQHAFLDLDEDGYEEPYIITVHKETQKVLRIVARYEADGIKLDEKGKKVIKIKPVNYFTDYHFLPSPDGTFMSIGFGILMLHLQETVNTILNQLIDAGSLANMQTGIIDSRIKLMGGQMGVDPGQWTRAKGVLGQQLKDGLVPIQYKEPSTVLFQLLGLLIQTAKDLTSSTDVMQGAISGTNVPATTMLSMVEQGMKRFSAIQKRLYRSLKEEYRKIFRLNGLYSDPEEFSRIVGIPGLSPRDVYSNENLRVFPVADPNLATDAQRLAQAQVIMGIAQQPDSLINKYEAQKRMLEAAKVANIPALLPQQAAQAPQKPDPKMMKIQIDGQAAQADAELKGRQQDLKEKQFAAQLAKMEAEIQQMQANAVNLVSMASKTQHTMKMSEHAASLDTIKTKLDAVAQAHKQASSDNANQADFLMRQKELAAQQQADMQSQQNVNSDKGIPAGPTIQTASEVPTSGESNPGPSDGMA